MEDHVIKQNQDRGSIWDRIQGEKRLPLKKCAIYNKQHVHSYIMSFDRSSYYDVNHSCTTVCVLFDARMYLHLQIFCKCHKAQVVYVIANLSQ
jgi:hypothetical protein